MTSLLQPPLITRLLAAERILVAGAGGGFDVYAGPPRQRAPRRFPHRPAARGSDRP
ncbi:hypothetical protein [Kitasatospora sp. NPDC087314]|uniref:hypothetical protein n=1 Tax=Kitasatospora sp. NPDC087314 TaxID=3364068 RepID=UPI00382F2FC2